MIVKLLGINYSDEGRNVVIAFYGVQIKHIFLQLFVKAVAVYVYETIFSEQTY